MNNRQVEICALKPTDRINIGGVEMQLQPITARQEIRQAELRTKAASGWDSITNLMLLTLLQCMMFRVPVPGRTDGTDEHSAGIRRHYADPVGVILILCDDQPEIL